MKTARLVALLVRRSPFRPVMLALLTAGAIMVFSVVTELSRVSQEGLDSAILRDHGLLGSYEVTLSGALDPVNAHPMITGTAEGLGLKMWGYWEDLPEVESECPPYEEVGPQKMRVLWRDLGVPYELPFGQVSGIETVWCIAGFRIPENALHVPDDEARAVLGSRLYLRSDYRELVVLSTTAPVERGYTLVSGVPEDVTEELRRRLVEALTPHAVASGVHPGHTVGVRRMDLDEASVRSASAGLAVTYDVIRWGVLALAALALVAVQSIATRQRAWFYGLARALGAGRVRVAAVLLVDTAIVVAGATALAVVTMQLLSGPIEAFAAEAFGVQARVLSAESLRVLVLGLLVVLALATTYPLVGVLRRDPLAVLEAPRD